MTQVLSDAIGGWMFITGLVLMCGVFVYGAFGLPDYKPKPKTGDQAVGDTS